MNSIVSSLTKSSIFSPDLKFSQPFDLAQYNQETKITATVEIKITSSQNSQIALQIAEEAVRNLWHLKKYLDEYIAHLQGAYTDDEFDEISNKYIKDYNDISDEDIRICGSYLLKLLPEINLDDIAVLLNIDFEKLNNLITG